MRIDANGLKLCILKLIFQRDTVVGMSVLLMSCQHKERVPGP